MALLTFGFVDVGIVVSLENDSGACAFSLDDLVLEFKDHPLGALEPDTLDGFYLVDVLRDDGFADFVGGHGRKYHPRGRRTYAGDADDEFEKFALVLGGEAVHDFSGVPLVDGRKCINPGILAVPEGFVGLQGNLESVAHAVVCSSAFTYFFRLWRMNLSFANLFIILKFANLHE